ncbi:MAG: CAP domain-containing protein [Acidobacteriota bacterium]
MLDFLHHLFVPRESNGHRSKLLHHDSLLLVIAFLVAGLVIFAGAQKQYPAVLGDATSISVEELLSDTNLKRQEHGLVPLTLNTQLSQAAAQKAQDMFAKNYWAHVSPDGTTPWVFIKASGYEYLYAGENLARGFDNSSAVVEAWMNSPTHRENVLSAHYTDIGFAIQSGTLTGTDTILVVQEFGSPYSGEDETAVNGQSASVPSPVPTVYQTADTAVPSPTSVPIAQDPALQAVVPQAGVSTIENKPLVDSSNVRLIIFFFVLLFLVALAVDALYIERKNIMRTFSHNVDHMLFLLFILVVGILIGRGVII